MLTEASGVSSDYVVGQWDLYNQVNHCFIYNIAAGTYTNFDDPLAGTATYQGTSASGVSGNYVVGFYVDSASRSHGFIYNLWPAGTFTTLDDPATRS